MFKVEALLVIMDLYGDNGIIGKKSRNSKTHIHTLLKKKTKTKTLFRWKALPLSNY